MTVDLLDKNQPSNEVTSHEHDGTQSGRDVRRRDATCRRDAGPSATFVTLRLQDERSS